MPVDPRAWVGFQRAASRYDRARPEAPPAAIDALVRSLKISRQSTVVELGAGTGKLSRLLVPRSGTYLALEPVPAMREQFRRALPSVPIVGGMAEMLPIHPSSVDAIVAAQAFHWFDVPRAMREMHRVLRPGGTVGLLWNVRDESVEWVHQVTEIIDRYDEGGPRFHGRAWREGWTRTPGFDPLELQSFPFVQRADRETTLERFTSVSFIASLDEARYAEAEARLRRLLDKHPMTAGRAEIELPYNCEVYSSRSTRLPAVRPRPGRKSHATHSAHIS
ncbi:MAG: class I SAM-dependent methyltransferase [Thermoplasmata archaeon]|nr:class I SAM-dependent methyltransferase [Thermoplasmata archaeon]